MPIQAIYAQAPDNLHDEDIDLEDILEDIPSGMNLSEAGEDDIRSLPFFGLPEAKLYIAFRDSLSGGEGMRSFFSEIPGLNSIQSAILKFTEERARMMRPGNGQARTGMIVFPERGMRETKYYTVVKMTNGDNLRFGFLGERDSFEPRALDSYSAHAVIRLSKLGGAVVLGDYRLGIGQGLVWSRHQRTYASGTAVIRRDSPRPENTSWEESLFLRGGMVDLERRRFGIKLWSSARMLDASGGEAGAVYSIRTSGLHESGSVRENLSEKIGGAQFSVRSDAGSVSVSGSVVNYSPALAPSPGERNVYGPESGSFRYLSASGVMDHRKMSVFFETAVMNEKERAFISGIVLRRNTVRACLAVRRYSIKYWALRASSLSVFGNPSNEEGGYAAVEAKLPFEMNLEGSLDMARTLGRTYSANMPLSRKKTFISAGRKLHRYVDSRISYRLTRDSGENAARESLAWRIESDFGRLSPCRLRALAAWSAQGDMGGPYGEASVGYAGKGPRIEMNVGIFSLPSYQARFYRYETNVPGRGSSGAVWGRGVSMVSVCGLGAVSIRYRAVRSDQMGVQQEITLQGDCGF